VFLLGLVYLIASSRSRSRSPGSSAHMVCYQSNAEQRSAAPGCVLGGAAVALLAMADIAPTGSAALLWGSI
jgi:hypothetical protein